MTIEEILEFLCKKPKVIGLVKMLPPKNIIKIIAKTFDLQPADAEKVSDGLLKHNFSVHNKRKVEGVPFGSFEKSSQYPIPVKLKKRKTDEDDLGEDEIVEGPSGPLGKDSGFSRPDIKKSEFPPQRHREKDKVWPYDDMTVQFMKKRPGYKRGFTK